MSFSVNGRTFQLFSVVPIDCESYTNSDGSFGPVVGMPLLVDRYDYLEVIGQGQSSILLKAKARSHWILPTYSNL